MDYILIYFYHTMVIIVIQVKFTVRIVDHLVLEHITSPSTITHYLLNIVANSTLSST